MSPDPTARHYDVIVVGAGIAGSLVARRLGEHGHRVLVLEAGVGAADAASGHRDALRTYYTAAGKGPSSPYAPNAAVPWPEVSDLAGLEGGGFRAGGYFRQTGPLPYASGYVRVNGGTGNVWTGLTPRMHPEDFRTATSFGYGRDWPIGYDDLEPHYRDAEHEIGVAADADEQRVRVGLPLPQDYVFPMRAIPPSRLDRTMADRLNGCSIPDPVTGEPVELYVCATPQGRNGEPHPGYDGGAGYRLLGVDGRPDAHSRCTGSASCIPLCPTGAKYTPLKTQGRWSPSVTLLDRAVVSRVLVTGSGRARGIEYLRYGDSGTPVTRHTVAAQVVVLAAHAVENAKLLLHSGLAARSGQLGRNLMDHPVLLTWGLMPGPVSPYRDPGSTSGLEGFRFGPARSRRAPFRVEIGNWGWLWAKGPVDGDVAELLEAGLLGDGLREAVADRVGRQFSLQFEMEQEADPANRITLDHDRTDPLGLPRPAVHYDLSDHVKDGIAAAKQVSDRMFALLGAEDHTDYAPGPAWPGHFERRGRSYAFRGAGHAAGTHIMGATPADSVVDSWQRCWEHPGLYAVGCGSLPTVATSNPTLSMAALALRSADHITAELAGRRRSATLPAPATSGDLA